LDELGRTSRMHEVPNNLCLINIWTEKPSGKRSLKETGVEDRTLRINKDFKINRARKSEMDWPNSALRDTIMNLRAS
jgi:hypothetical protein